MTKATSTSQPGPSGRGAFLVFEGLDRSGKTTQARRLAEYVEQELNAPVRQIKFPDRSTATGQIINAYLGSTVELNDNAVHLLFAANRWEKRREMQELLEAGVTLIVDRYSYSGVAFSAAKGNPHLDRDWCASPERGLLAPDAVFFLDMDPSATTSREEYGAERYETEDFQRVVRAEFQALADGSFHVIDAARSIEAVCGDVMGVATPVLERCRAGAPLQELWGRSPSQLAPAAPPCKSSGDQPATTADVAQDT